jgi:protein-S-isoprenylcysteine O-methyltransferase Ste14
MTLRSKLATRFLLGVLFFGTVLFLPVGTLHFWQGWLYLMIWCLPGLGVAAYLYKRNRQLLERRLQMKEGVREQRLIMGVLYVFYLAGIVIAGLDHRFGWSHVPVWLTIVSVVILLGGYVVVLWVMRVNSFASRTIQVESGQTVIADGPYHLVRHPMYFGMSLMMLFTPLVLGSFYALPVFAVVVSLIILRLLNEEKVLRQQLAGYSDYCLRTRFHLVPYLW